MLSHAKMGGMLTHMRTCMHNGDRSASCRHKPCVTWWQIRILWQTSTRYAHTLCRKLHRRTHANSSCVPTHSSNLVSHLQQGADDTDDDENDAEYHKRENDTFGRVHQLLHRHALLQSDVRARPFACLCGLVIPHPVQDPADAAAVRTDGDSELIPWTSVEFFCQECTKALNLLVLAPGSSGPDLTRFRAPGVVRIARAQAYFVLKRTTAAPRATANTRPQGPLSQ